MEINDKCSLCGGRIVNGRCAFCGMRDVDPAKRLTVSTKKSEKKQQYGGGRENKNQISANVQGKKKKTIEDTGKKVSAVISIAAAAVVLIPVLFELGKSILGSIQEPEITYSDMENGNDPYAFVTREIPAEGSEFSSLYDSGIYRCGIHIPEGEYEVELIEGEGTMYISDYENGIYDMTYFGDEPESGEVTGKSGVRIYNGAQIIIDTDIVLSFTTVNAQPFTGEIKENPETETIKLQAGSFTVGRGKIPEGMFDICFDVSGENMYSDINLFYPNGESYYFWLNNINVIQEGDPYNKGRIQNVVFSEGTSVQIADEGIWLEPSEGYYDVVFSEYPY